VHLLPTKKKPPEQTKGINMSAHRREVNSSSSSFTDLGERRVQIPIMSKRLYTLLRSFDCIKPKNQIIMTQSNNQKKGEAGRRGRETHSTNPYPLKTHTHTININQSTFKTHTEKERKKERKKTHETLPQTCLVNVLTLLTSPYVHVSVYSSDSGY
jgi:hypothetical protein